MTKRALKQANMLRKVACVVQVVSILAVLPLILSLLVIFDESAVRELPLALTILPISFVVCLGGTLVASFSKVVANISESLLKMHSSSDSDTQSESPEETTA